MLYLVSKRKMGGCPISATGYGSILLTSFLGTESPPPGELPETGSVPPTSKDCWRSSGGVAAPPVSAPPEEGGAFSLGNRHKPSAKAILPDGRPLPAVLPIRDGVLFDAAQSAESRLA